MPVIIVRHGNDEVKKPKYPQDPSITPSSQKRARKLYRKLVKRYGQPTAIYCSPMRRARDTVTAFECPSEIVRIRPHLSRYFTSNEKREVKIHKRSLALGVPLSEDWTQFKNRCQHFAGRLRQKKGLIIIVTHALVIKELSEFFQVPIAAHQKFLYTLPLLPLGNQLSQPSWALITGFTNFLTIGQDETTLIVI